MSFKAQIPVRSVTMPNLLNILFFALTVFTATALASPSDVTFKFDELSGPPSAGRLPVRSQEFARSPLLEVDELSNAVRLARGLHLRNSVVTSLDDAHQLLVSISPSLPDPTAHVASSL